MMDSDQGLDNNKLLNVPMTGEDYEGSNRAKGDLN